MTADALDAAVQQRVTAQLEGWTSPVVRRWAVVAEVYDLEDSVSGVFVFPDVDTTDAGVLGMLTAAQARVLDDLTSVPEDD